MAQSDPVVLTARAVLKRISFAKLTAQEREAFRKATEGARRDWEQHTCEEDGTDPASKLVQPQLANQRLPKRRSSRGEYTDSTAQSSERKPQTSHLADDFFGAPRPVAPQFPFPLLFMQSRFWLTNSDRHARPYYERDQPAKVAHRLNQQNNIIEVIGAALDDYDRDLLFAIFALIAAYGRTILGSNVRLVTTTLDELCAIIGRTARGDYEAIKQSLSRLASHTWLNVRAEIINGRPRYQWRGGVKLLEIERVNHYELEIMRPGWIDELIYKLVNYEVYQKLKERYSRGLYLLFEAQEPDKRHVFRAHELHLLLGVRNEKPDKNFGWRVRVAAEEVQKHAPQFQVQYVRGGELQLEIRAKSGVDIEPIEREFWTKNNARMK